MKAAVISAKDSIHLQQAPIPEIGDGEALIRLRYCGICGSDLHVLHGQHPTARFPVVPGHEFVGELIEARGMGAEQFAPGDMVVAQPFFSCGNCEPCAQGHDNVCRDLHFMGAHCDGAFAEYVKVLTRKMYKIPKELNLRLAALAEPVAVAVHDVRRSGLQVGQTALIIGGGPIGMLIAMVARASGARRVVISEINAFRRGFAERHGFDTLNPLDADFAAQIGALTEGKGFDVSFEVSGSRPGIAAAVEHTTIGGMIMVVGMTKEPYPVDLSAMFSKELRMQGVRIHAQYNFIGAVELLKSGELNEAFASLISKVYPLDQVEEAFAFADVPGDYFKVLVEMQ
ncbi:alcohol dehydrogenase catalytic domain-containing protein [Agathobaculum sp. NTUH-O15-33]|uniref:zinc-dependent alcohol dehydrogenase n=1 Tax=Agathobaculum sp. NTUH-O15-33 TaxID=3079302 RepID=UPI0029587873|nr:alcohol dehydrogenase catalytic domain-containing protein [Agathobaculum sp. NTUH-O15-33]WNX85491.1 alcohol dehydrogenase catalytic domain-containing protein [Agathobaculum sp. NTUH-O15-33]